MKKSFIERYNKIAESLWFTNAYKDKIFSDWIELQNQSTELISERNMDKEKTIAERLHDSIGVRDLVEDTISDAFEKYEPEIYKELEFTIGSDYYDNSIEIYIKNVIPYPYEPCWEIRDIIYDLGFGIVYWNFADENGNFIEEIRGSEPRRYKPNEKRTPEMYDKKFCGEMWDKWKINGVDKRFNGDEWFKKYKRK